MVRYIKQQKRGSSHEKVYYIKVWMAEQGQSRQVKNLRYLNQ